MAAYVKCHIRRVAISAGVVTVFFGLYFSGDFGLWRTVIMGGATFLVFAAFVYMAIGAFGFLGRSQARSETLVEEAAAIALSDGFNFDPTDAIWVQADQLYRDALEIEPTNTGAAYAHDSFICETLAAGGARFDAAQIEDLPAVYRQLPDSLTPGFVWVGFQSGPTWPARPDSWVGRVRRFIVNTVGGNADPKPSWIAGLIATTVVLVFYMADWRATVESPLSRSYRSICEQVLGECGGEIRGFDRTDAYDALRATLQQRFPLQLGPRVRARVTCWELIDRSEVGVRPLHDEGHFVVFLGHQENDYGDIYVVTDSEWIVRPPTDDSGWQITAQLAPGLSDGYTCAE